MSMGEVNLASGKPDITERMVAHFPGFEPLGAVEHHARYRRSADRSAAAFGFTSVVSELGIDGPAPSFSVFSADDGWQTHSRMHILGHSDLIMDMAAAPLRIRALDGFAVLLSLIRDGTLFRYMSVSWRYGLYCLFPFAMVLVSGLAIIAAAAMPYWLALAARDYFWSLPVAVVLLYFGLIPAARNLHVSSLFDQWRLAARLSHMVHPELEQLVGTHAAALKTVMERKADDYLVTAHSLGGVFAVLALGRLIEREPALFHGKIVTLVTLAGSGLQVSLMKRSHALREATRRVVECPEIYWLDYQCLADPVHLYGSKITRELSRLDSSFGKLESPPVVTIRIKDMLDRDHYAKIRWDILRVHRQFVFASDRPYRYDFISLTAGPFAASSFAANNLSNYQAAGVSVREEMPPQSVQPVPAQ